MESWLSPVCFIPAPGLKLPPGENWLGWILSGCSWWVWFGQEKFGDFCPARTQDWMNSGLDMVGPGDLKGLSQPKYFCVSMALSLPLGAPGGLWVPLRIEGLFLCSGAGRACWVAQHRDVPFLAGMILLLTGTGKSRQGVRPAPPHPGAALGEDGAMESCLMQTTPAPVQAVLSGIVGAGFWDGRRGV